MAPSPKYLQTRRLVRNFFKKYLPKQPENVPNGQQLLINCWKTYGIEDPRCDDLVQMCEITSEIRENYKKKIESLRIKQQVMGTLRPPLFKEDLKGRFKNRDRVWTIYDGLDGLKNTYNKD